MFWIFCLNFLIVWSCSYSNNRNDSNNCNANANEIKQWYLTKIHFSLFAFYNSSIADQCSHYALWLVDQQVASSWSIPWWLCLVIAIGALFGGIALVGFFLGILIALCKINARRRRRREIAPPLLPLRKFAPTPPFTVSGSVPILMPTLKSPQSRFEIGSLPPYRRIHFIEIK